MGGGGPALERGAAVLTGPYDALLLVSFGGPERAEDVIPFLQNVTRGRDVPRARLEAVAEHYYALGGASPINGQNRALLAALRAELDPLPVFWGNRNWDPLLTAALTEMRDAGVRRALAFVTSAFASYSGCRQYREDLAAARAAVGPGAPEIAKLRHYFDHPGFVLPVVDRVGAALAGLDGRPRLVFTAHSIPASMAAASGPSGGAYEAELRASCAAVASRVGGLPWELVYQSRSGPPRVPWLGPDVLDHLRALAAAAGDRDPVVLVPIGFVSDHMEVVYDLDTEARSLAASLGLTLVRAGTVGTDPRFVAMVGELVAERQAADAGADPDRPALSPLGPAWDVCPLGCCAPAVRRPAAAGEPADEWEPAAGR